MDPQSVLVPQCTPSAQLGAHAGEAHVPFTQLSEEQSAFAPQLLPIVQVGEHPGAWQTLPLHRPDPQSPFETQAAPSAQVGPQPAAAGLHFPLTQSAEVQSPFAPHAAPVPQLGEQADATQRPAVHFPEPQSVLPPQGCPRTQSGAHSEGPHVPFTQR